MRARSSVDYVLRGQCLCLVPSRAAGLEIVLLVRCSGTSIRQMLGGVGGVMPEVGLSAIATVCQSTMYSGREIPKVGSLASHARAVVNRPHHDICLRTGHGTIRAALGSAGGRVQHRDMRQTTRGSSSKRHVEEAISSTRCKDKDEIGERSIRCVGQAAEERRGGGRTEERELG